jgi:hypothetical protein
MTRRYAVRAGVRSRRPWRDHPWVWMISNVFGMRESYASKTPAAQSEKALSLGFGNLSAG